MAVVRLPAAAAVAVSLATHYDHCLCAVQYHASPFDSLNYMRKSSSTSNNKNAQIPWSNSVSARA